ncbi:alpha/beta hydrolase [Dactylosporangium sucinum]|uniref:Lipase/esterase n=1 Tax=Dactylosporangium sucinum TaxID=1424081 RepID=A0A917TP02_9ACTN|nr:alpha/beta hydrolase [Dactylosporangium sucinum]GGM30546.1 putative lipase/esterase [Dactylosporangium sucinum]
MDPTRLHPQARAALGAQPREPLTVANLAAVRQSMVAAVPDEVGLVPAPGTVVDVDANGVPARLFRDGTAGASPVILYAHGGGWALGDLDTHDGLCRALAAETGWSVLAVHYRRAPEHPFPAAPDDLDTALTWLRDHGAAHGVDPAPTAVAGDSAGGHLATVAARRARDAGRPLAAQLLICPVVDPAQDYPDLDDYGLHRDEMRFFWDAYAPPGVDRAVPDLSPHLADLAGLPPTVIVTAELDILRPEAERYAAALSAAGVPVISACYQGMVHNFPRKLALFDAAHAALAQLGAALRHWVPVA